VAHLPIEMNNGQLYFSKEENGMSEEIIGIVIRYFTKAAINEAKIGDVIPEYCIEEQIMDMK
jgi:hypothetical protein